MPRRDRNVLPPAAVEIVQFCHENTIREIMAMPSLAGCTPGPPKKKGASRVEQGGAAALTSEVSRGVDRRGDGEEALSAQGEGVEKREVEEERQWQWQRQRGGQRQ